MIWIWLKRALFGFGLLIIPPTRSAKVIDVNAACPACGHRNGALKFQRVDKDNKPVAAVRHDCKVCGCGWYEEVCSAPKWPAT